MSTLEKCKPKLKGTYYPTIVKIAIIKKSANKKSWRGCGEKGILLYCWWEYIISGSSHYGKYMTFP